MRAYVRYIEDSTDEDIKPSNVIYSKEPNEYGVKNEVFTEGGIVKTVGLGEVAFKDENDLKTKVNIILEEMGY